MSLNSGEFSYFANCSSQLGEYNTSQAPPIFVSGFAETFFSKSAQNPDNVLQHLTTTKPGGPYPANRPGLIIGAHSGSPVITPASRPRTPSSSPLYSGLRGEGRGEGPKRVLTRSFTAHPRRAQHARIPRRRAPSGKQDRRRQARVRAQIEVNVKCIQLYAICQVRRFVESSPS